MRVNSIGWRSDLALRELEGAEIAAGAGHLLIRTPENRDFRWGNFMLLARAPGPGEAGRWIERFKAAFPAAAYVAIGIERPPTEADALAELVALGLRVESSTILTSAGLRPPEREPPAAVIRRLEGDGDWAQAVALSLEMDETEDGRDYIERRTAAIRRVCEGGHGAWFGAFREGEMHAGLGIFGVSGGLARFQGVDTHPAHRRQGLASHLLLAAGQYALSHLSASTLVIAADPEYHAIGIYRGLGFADHEHHIQLERLGAPD